MPSQGQRCHRNDKHQGATAVHSKTNVFIHKYYAVTWMKNLRKTQPCIARRRATPSQERRASVRCDFKTISFRLIFQDPVMRTKRRLEMFGATKVATTTTSAGAWRPSALSRTHHNPGTITTGRQP